MEEFFEKGRAGRRLDERIARRFQAKEFIRSCLSSALHNIGSATLLDLLADVFPDRPNAASRWAIGGGQQGK